MADRCFEDFEIGQTYAVGGRTVTETDIVLLASLIGANAPLFLNEEYAKQTPFGTRIAPGELTLSFAMAATEPLVHGGLVGLLGIDKVRFRAPVKAGDTITNHVQVIARRPSARGGRGIVTLANSVRNQRGEEVATFEHTVLLRARGG
ncbi:MAG: MaoC family dehydratase [Chloroflexi bacterium]|nr:MaoC family dehydratase [Chloroflexota bacterium]